MDRRSRGLAAVVGVGALLLLVAATRPRIGTTVVANGPAPLIPAVTPAPAAVAESAKLVEARPVTAPPAELLPTREMTVSRATLPSGIRAELRARRLNVPEGEPLGVELRLLGKDGKLLKDPLPGMRLLVSNGEKPPFEASLVQDVAKQGLWNGFFNAELKGPRGNANATVILDQHPGQEGAASGVTVSLRVGRDAELVERPVAVWLQAGLMIRQRVRASREATLALRGDLVDANGVAIGTGTGAATMPAGEGLLYIDFTHVISSPSDARVAGLQVGNVGLFSMGESGGYLPEDARNDNVNPGLAP